MLESGVHFKGTMAQKCHPCGTDDDENHTLNTCIKYNDTNRANDPLKSSFEHVYNDDNDTVNRILNDIQNVWELRYANGRMKKPT